MEIFLKGFTRRVKVEVCVLVALILVMLCSCIHYSDQIVGDHQEKVFLPSEFPDPSALSCDPEAGDPISASRSVVQVDAGKFATCALDTSGRAHCWGRLVKNPAPERTFRKVIAGYRRACAIDHNNFVACWDYSGSSEIFESELRFVDISSAYFTWYGITTSGELFEEDAIVGQLNVVGEIKDLNAGSYFACWLDDGGIRCNVGPQFFTLPEGRFESLTCNEHFCCAIDESHDVHCFGRDVTENGVLNPPEATFIELAAGFAHVCGIEESGHVRCWGNNERGQATPPPGRFVSISAGQAHTCAIDESQQVICWGEAKYIFHHSCFDAE